MRSKYYISGYEILPTKMLGHFPACLLGLKGCIFFHLERVATVTHKGHAANKSTAAKVQI